MSLHKEMSLVEMIEFVANLSTKEIDILVKIMAVEYKTRFEKEATKKS